MTDFSYLHADRVAKANPGLTAEQIRSMPMADFARLMGREPIRPTVAPAPGPAPQVEATRTDEVEPDPISIAEMTYEEYAEFRKQAGIGQSRKEGKGIFDSVSSRSEAYRAAASQQAGRNAMVTSNVIPSPSISRPNLVNVNQPALDSRPLADRFGAASNQFRYEG